MLIIKNKVVPALLAPILFIVKKEISATFALLVPGLDFMCLEPGEIFIVKFPFTNPQFLSRQKLFIRPFLMVKNIKQGFFFHVLISHFTHNVLLHEGALAGLKLYRRRRVVILNKKQTDGKAIFSWLFFNISRLI